MLSVWKRIRKTPSLTETAFKSFTLPDALIDKFNPSSASATEAFFFSKFTFSAISKFS